LILGTRFERTGPLAAKAARRRPARGQSLTEFALIAPVLLAFLGIGTDFARMYFAWVKLESATRDAAQYVASDPAHFTTGGYYDSTDSTNYCGASGWTTCTSAPSTDAQGVLQNETGLTFTKSSTQTTCTSPKVWAIVSAPVTSAAAGGSTQYPVVTAHITACQPFRSLIPYPVLSQNGSWILRTDRTLTTIVGR
jgi:Flp pilus assembly protein TadG